MKNNIKEDFINSFGEEKWKQEEMLSKLIEPQKELCEYLGVEMIPVVCEYIEEDSRYYFKDDYIVISPLMLESYTDALKSLAHEIRHQYQYKCANDPNTKENHILVNDWRQEFSNLKRPVDSSNQESVNEYFSMMTELDAAAFSKWYLEWKYDIHTVHPNIIYDEFISQYIKKYFK